MAVVTLLALLAASVTPAQTANPKVAILKLGGSTLEIRFDSSPSPEFRQLTLNWITRAANAVDTYYNRFPVRRVDIAIHVGKGAGVGPGSASGEDGAHIRIKLGEGVELSSLTSGGNSWLMTHEMVHLALSSVEEEHHWIEEGLATYVEPIARARAGELTAQKVWYDMVEGMPQGEPTSGDRGLDYTPTWGRTYWGGAMYCLLADVEIRKQSNNRIGLETALRGIVTAGGTIESNWGLARVLATGDQAIGFAVLRPLYDRMKSNSNPVDLEAVWRELGVEDRDGSVIFHNDAPLANVRLAITSP